MSAFGNTWYHLGYAQMRVTLILILKLNKKSQFVIKSLCLVLLSNYD